LGSRCFVVYEGEMSRILPVDFVADTPEPSTDPEQPPVSSLITPEWLRKGHDDEGWEGWRRGLYSGLLVPLCFRMQRPFILRALNIPEQPTHAVAAWYTGAAHGTALNGTIVVTATTACVLTFPSFYLAGTGLLIYLFAMCCICYSLLWAEIFRWQWCINVPPPPDALGKVEACRRLNPSPKSCAERYSTLCKSYFVRYGKAYESSDSVRQELGKAGFNDIPEEHRDTYHGAAGIANDVLRTVHCTFFFLAFFVAMMPMALHDLRGRAMQRDADGSYALSTYNAYVWFLTLIFPLVFMWPAGHIGLAVGRVLTRLRLKRFSRKSGLTGQGLHWVLTWNTPVWEQEPPFTLWLVRTHNARKAALALLLALVKVGDKKPPLRLPQDLLRNIADFIAAAHTATR